MKRQRYGFWHEDVYSQSGAAIPMRLRKKATSKWSIHAIVGELLREPGHCSHVAEPLPPVHVWGLPPSALHDRVRDIYEGASKIRESYVRRGRKHERVQKKNTPTLLMAVASWPEPTMEWSAERDRWVGLVIEAARTRFGECFKGAYAHVDEARWHLHLWIDDGGREVKTLHGGFNWAYYAALEGKTRAEQAVDFRAGLSRVGDWYHETVGEPIGWARKSPSPQPRAPRPEALRKRQADVERQEDLAADMTRRAKAAEKMVVEQAGLLAAARLKLLAREAKVARKVEQVREYTALLARMREDIQDQAALEERFRANRYDDPSVF